jgi:pimeloyl-ACP methyl ester carboxylesterase
MTAGWKMFSSSQLLKSSDKNPIVDITGFIAHIGTWITSSSSDMIYHNPKYKVADDKSMDQGQRIAIYCVHGTADRAGSFSQFAERLMTNLPPTISSIVLAAFDTGISSPSIEVFSQQLINKIKANKDTNVILMGHSRGGLIAAHCAEYFAKDAGVKVRAVIPICTPFGGSPLAIAPLTWMSASVGQMQKDSPFLKGLQDKIEKSSVTYLYYAAANDSLVALSDCYVKTQVNHLTVLDHHGHVSIMSSQRLVDHVRNKMIALALSADQKLEKVSICK